jgi:peptidoglycan L-alanyl-D-glutamate endopeptidase CwlK
MIRDINTLVPIVREKWLEVKADLKATGIEVMEVETRRDKRTQMAYWAQGREALATVNLKRNAIGLPSITEKQNRMITRTQESIHFYDCALDFALVINGSPSWNTKADINNDNIGDYENVGVIAKSHGFEWGGDFSFKDYAHLQFTGGLSIIELRGGQRPERDVLDYI